ncbi:hypothetical protein OH786_34950 (plasmid) [Streptomyces atratus]|uniref:hypothetical protein n=1 Tax=Streptomyces atratus TaxID=1893 RepID=UPI001C430984|nr:hypothetical protein [Streptomyces atratus]
MPTSPRPPTGRPLTRTAAGELPARVYAVVSLDQAADAHRATAEGGLRGRYIICP